MKKFKRIIKAAFALTLARGCVAFAAASVDTATELTSPAFDSGVMYKTVKALSSPEMEGRAPLSHGSRLAREYIIERMKAYGLEPGGDAESYVKASHGKIRRKHTVGNNVLGILRGKTLPDECVYVDAHYDHWGRAGGQLQPGANDNATGVALMLEIARAMSKNPPDRSVVFFAPDREEGAMLPMFGGIKGANDEVRHPVCAKQNIKGALILDTLGGPFIKGVQPRLILIGSESSRASYESAQRVAGNGTGALMMGVYALEPLGKGVPRGDYGAFRRIKVPFIFATSGIPSDYHTANDTISKVDFGFMQQTGPKLLELAQDMASAAYQPQFEKNTAAIDWRRELATISTMVDEILGVPGQNENVVEKFTKISEHLAALAKESQPDPKRIKPVVSKTVISVMTLNSSLKLWEHIYRTPRVPHEKP